MTTYLGPKIYRTREELAKRFPACFRPKGELKLPLAVGVREAVFERAPELDRALVAMAIRNYVEGRKYQCTLFEGAPRYNLDGRVVALVTANEAQWAVIKMQHLEERWARRAETWKQNRKQKKSKGILRIDWTQVMESAL